MVRTALEVASVLNRAGREYTSWDLKDQLVYTAKITELAEFADGILQKYDGREDRLNQVIESLLEE